MTVITLNISEPKTSVHLTPSLDDVREIQVLDFVRVRKPFVRLMEQQKVYNLTNSAKSFTPNLEYQKFLQPANLTL